METHRCRVLVVDDDRDSAQMFAALLEAMGHDVTFLTDPTKVIETARALQPQVVFLDLHMPRLDGWELARQLRELDRNARKPMRLVAVSGRIDEEARTKSRKAGFDAHVLKATEPALIESIFKQLPC
jgi:CheY-like chemotaxis protein